MADRAQRAGVLLAASTQIMRGRLTPTSDQIERLAALAGNAERGVIICGPRCPEDDFPEAVAHLARRAGFPLLADPLSGLRFGPWVEEGTASLRGAPVLGGYEGYLGQGGPELEAPDLVLRFGAAPTSKWLTTYLARSAAIRTVHVRSNGVWADETHLTSIFLQAEESEVCRQLTSALQMLPERKQNRLAGAFSGHRERLLAAAAGGDGRRILRRRGHSRTT